MTRIDPGGIGQNHEFFSNAAQNIGLVASREHGVTVTIREKCVAREKVISHKKAAAPRSMTRRVYHLELFRAKLDDLTIGQFLIKTINPVPWMYRRLGSGRLLDLFECGDMIKMAMCGKYDFDLQLLHGNTAAAQP